MFLHTDKSFQVTALNIHYFAVLTLKGLRKLILCQLFFSNFIENVDHSFLMRTVLEQSLILLII